MLWVVYLGVFPTAIAFTTYAYALQHMSASNLGVTTYLVPPITIVMGVVFLDEAPPTMAYVGGALALVGVAVARRKPRTARPTRPRRRPECVMLRGMDVVAYVLVGLVAALHLYFLVLEMFLWTKPLGRKTFGNTAEFAEASKVLAANQGLYNGFLVAGLVWGLVAAAVRRLRVLPRLRDRRRGLRRGHRQPPDPVRAGGAGATRARRRPARRGESSSPTSSQPRKASRLWVDSPRSLRHSHSLRIERGEAELEDRVERLVGVRSAPSRAAGRARRA